MIGGSACLVRAEDTAGRQVLHDWSGVIDGAATLGAPVVIAIQGSAFVALSLLLMFAAVGLALRLRAGRADDVTTLTVVMLAILAQGAWLWNYVVPGIVIAVGMLVVSVMPLVWRSSDREDEGRQTPSATFAWTDCWLLLAISLMAWLLRLYALNRVPGTFEGELAPYYLGASTLGGIPLANAGSDGPWAPLGLLFYLPIHAAVSYFGPSVLAVRFASASMSLLTLALLYAFGSRWFGRGAAICAAVFFALDPLQIGWGRTDVHPHGVTAWTLLVMCWVTLTAYESGRVRWFVVLAALMTISWHQYPSGQFAVLIPLLFFGVTALRPAGLDRRQSTIRLVSLGLGLALWLAGPTIAHRLAGESSGIADYLTRLGPRIVLTQPAPFAVSTDTVKTLAIRVSGATGDLLAGLFVELRHRFHQDVLIPISGWPTRSLSWLVAALALAGLAMMFKRQHRPAGTIVACWIVAAALPAILSETVYPKRSAALFPALFIVAGVAAQEVARVSRRLPAWWRRPAFGAAVVSVAVWFCVSAQLWFSPVNVRYGTDSETRVANWVTASLRPGTIVIADLWHTYTHGKLS
jgi:4-amino-4-deoxy-L-arabinose transferase-like glycosyltransferase